MDLAGLKGAIEKESVQEAGESRKFGHVVCDSRQVGPGDIFVAVRGVQADGHDFIQQAIQRRAAIVVVEQGEWRGAEVVRVKNSAAALGELAQAAAGRPSESLKVLGVTGTNGKTTVTYMVRAMLGAAGMGCGLMGTVEYDVGSGRAVTANNTTPDALRLAEMMRQMRENGLQAAVMECSSHGLDQNRTAGIRFTGAAFTNLTGDHLDYHGNRENYLKAKGKLFESLDGESIAILNGQDEASGYLRNLCRGGVWRFGIDTETEIAAYVKTMGIRGCEFDLWFLGEKKQVRSPLIGLHNVSNCLAAAGLAKAAGVELDAIVEAIEGFPGVPGRLETVDCGQGFSVLVDYAHTDDALERVLGALRQLEPRQLIVVFGCGGDRDRSKRPRMGRVVQTRADRVVITNDNPRSEKPESIIAEIRAGMTGGGRNIEEIPDRAAAIEHALGLAREGDVVLIAGKGHEDYQLVGGKRYEFDDRKVAREKLEKLGYNGRTGRALVPKA